VSLSAVARKSLHCIYASPVPSSFRSPASLSLSQLLSRTRALSAPCSLCSANSKDQLKGGFQDQLKGGFRDQLNRFQTKAIGQRPWSCYLLSDICNQRAQDDADRGSAHGTDSRVTELACGCW
jgi:hypothetical protein